MDLFPSKIALNGKNNEVYSVAGGIDSFYEYLLKEYIHMGQNDEVLKDRFVKSLDAILENLVGQDITGLYFIGTLENEILKPEMHQFACFFPGLMALAVNKLDLPKKENVLFLAEELAYTCYQMNHRSATGLSTESVEINNGIRYPLMIDTDHGLRPETIESFWYLYCYTKDPKYQKWA